jgi:hypothetical protein
MFLNAFLFNLNAFQLKGTVPIIDIFLDVENDSKISCACKGKGLKTKKN